MKSHAIDFHIVGESSASLGLKSTNDRIIGANNKTSPDIIWHPMRISSCIQIRPIVTYKTHPACSRII